MTFGKLYDGEAHFAKKWTDQPKGPVSLNPLTPSDAGLIASLNQGAKQYTDHKDKETLAARIYGEDTFRHTPEIQVTLLHGVGTIEDMLCIKWEAGAEDHFLKKDNFEDLLARQDVHYKHTHYHPQQKDKESFVIVGKESINKIAVMGIDFAGANTLRDQDNRLRTSQSVKGRG